LDTVRAHEGSAGRTASDVAAATLLARSGGRTHKQCRGIVINPDDLAVQLWAIPHSTDSELLGSRRCVHRPSTARVWATTLLDATPMVSKPTCDAGCHVTLGRERPSDSICDSLAANGGGKYLPT
jgi:hypothetical protein